MGNRAVITFSQASNSPCIYLHWNGGRASVEGFLSAARQLGLRHLDAAGGSVAGRIAEEFVMDDLAQLIAGSYFGCKVGMTVYRENFGQADTDNGDNGTYVLAPDLTIAGRLFAPRVEEVNQAKTASIAEHIVQRAPIFND